MYWSLSGSPGFELGCAVGLQSCSISGEMVSRPVSHKSNIKSEFPVAEFSPFFKVLFCHY